MKLRALGVFLAIVGAAGCDSDDGGGGGAGGVPGFGAGRAIKGPVEGATVEILALRPTGALGEELGSGATDATGAFEIEIGGFTGWAVARVTGGTFVDEDTGATLTIPPDAPLLGFVDVQELPSEFALTPLSTIAAALARSFAHDPEATVEDSVENALATTGAYFGIADLALVAPADLTAGPVAPGPEADAAIVVAALSELAADRGVPVLELTHALARDAGDGRFDGKEFGADIVLGGDPLPPTVATSELATSIEDFLGSPRNASGLDETDTAVDERLAASSGDIEEPIRLRTLENGFGLTGAVVTARLEASFVPATVQVLIGDEPLVITSLGADEIEFEIPAGLPLGLHDLVVRDAASGLVSRLRGAIEVFDPTDTPRITRIAPPAGPPTGGTLLRIEGANFGPQTLVHVDGAPLPLAPIAADFPRSMVVVMPPHDAGTVQVSVANPGITPVFVVDAFEYRLGDTRANPDLPAPTATTVFGAFRLFDHATNGVTAQVLSGRSVFTALDPTFSLTDAVASEMAPAIATRTRSGLVTLAPESLGQAFLLSDEVNAETDFFRGYTNEQNGVSLGATTSGPACFFPEPTDARVDLVARSYWVDGIEVEFTAARVRQKTGWLELDEELRGSASLRLHGRGLDGTAPSLAPETWTLECTLEDDGTLNVLRSIDGATELLTGRTSENADVAFLTLAASDGTLGFYLLTPIAFGVETGAFGGWAGGLLTHAIANDGGGDESALASGTFRELVSGDATERTGLAFERATRAMQSELKGVFSERVGARALDVTPSGRVLSGDSLVGYVGAASGVRLALGEFPDGVEPVRNPANVLGLGGAVFRDSRKSRDSLRDTRVQVSALAKLEELGAIRHQELATELAIVSFFPAQAPVVEGVAVALAGIVPELASTTLAGFHKATVRDSTGAVTTTRGAPPPYAAEVGYTFVDDELELFATAITGPGGRFEGASMPRWIASGTLGNDGEVASLRGSDEFLGDGLFFLVGLLGSAEVPEPAFEATAMRLGLELASLLPSAVVASRTELVFGGNGTFTAATVSRTLLETNTASTASTSGLGTHHPAGQTLRMVVPDGAPPDREWQTFWTPSLDAFFGIDDTPGTDRVELVLGTRRALSGGAFADDDRALLALELDPVLSRATTQQLFLAPRTSATVSGEAFTSQRDAVRALLHGEILEGAATTDLGAGRARVAFLTPLPSPPLLDFAFNARDDAIGQGDILLDSTLRIVHSHDL